MSNTKKTKGKVYVIIRKVIDYLCDITYEKIMCVCSTSVKAEKIKNELEGLTETPIDGELFRDIQSGFFNIDIMTDDQEEYNNAFIKYAVDNSDYSEEDWIKANNKYSEDTDIKYKIEEYEVDIINEQ